MTKKHVSPQQEKPPGNCDASERLYDLICKRVKWTTFSRLNIEHDEVASEVYLRLIDMALPNFETAEFRAILRNAIKRIIWDHRRPVKPMLDVDELTEEEHPFYMMDFFQRGRSLNSFLNSFVNHLTNRSARFSQKIASSPSSRSPISPGWDETPSPR